MERYIDITGHKFGRLIVVERAPSKQNNRQAMWKCICDCGETIICSGKNLRTGHTKSCGCLQKEQASLLGKSMCIDLTGRRFGRLTVIERADGRNNKYRNALWNCVCDCGNHVVVASGKLLGEHTQSCGCLHIEALSQANKTHGMSKTKLYGVWRSMRQRCSKPYCRQYKNYGGRGIQVCDEWNADFNAFYLWSMETGYKPGLTIDRIDVDGNYEPSNCRWATYKEQGNNKRSNIFLEFDGESHTLSEWSDITGIPYDSIRKKYKNGLPVEEVLHI